MAGRWGWGGVVLALACGLAQAEEGWTQQVTGPITVKSRPLPGNGVREIWAEGELNAPVQALQETLLDAARFPTFMPYVKETRVLPEPAPGGGRYVYTRLQLPFVQGRDYVTAVTVDRWVNADGTGTFEDHWVAAPDKVPTRGNLIRLKVNQGRWRATALPNGKSHVVYVFAVDPGGWVPGFVVEKGSKEAVLDTFRAVEREASARARQHAASASRH